MNGRKAMTLRVNKTSALDMIVYITKPNNIVFNSLQRRPTVIIVNFAMNSSNRMMQFL